MRNKNDYKHFSSSDEVNYREELKSLLDDCPIPDDQFLDNVGLFIDSKKLSRILFLNFIYEPKFVDPYFFGNHRKIVSYKVYNGIVLI